MDGAKKHSTEGKPRRDEIGALIRRLKGETKSSERMPADIERLFGRYLDWFAAQVDSRNPGPRIGILDDFDRICLRTGRPGAQGERAALCKALVARLGAATAKQARVLFLKTLRFLGRAESVETLMALLGDADAQIRELARQALANNPAPEVDGGLAAALANADSAQWRVAILNAIGYRRSGALRESVVPCLNDKDPTIALAAVSALGKIGGAQAVRALEQGLPNATPKIRHAIYDALLSCAEQMRAGGEGEAAASIYIRIRKDPRAPEYIRRAANRNRADGPRP